MRLYPWLIVFLFFSFGSQTALAVSISEIAWMGSTASANHEWIELYNAGEAVDVTGWILTDEANLDISLAGTIEAGAYVVLERNRSDGQSVVSTPFLNYSGSLINTGATLSVKRTDGSLVDRVVGGENWDSVGGDNATKETAQYSNNGWITAVATPGKANSQTASTPPTTSTPTVKNDSLVAKTVVENKVTIPWELSLKILAPDNVLVGRPVELRSEASGLSNTHLASLKYAWNFGDAKVATSSRVKHTYQHVGTYIVTLRAEFAGRYAEVEKSINVLPVSLSLARLANGNVQIYNDTMYKLDISGFRLVGSKTIIFPPRSYLAPKGALTFTPGDIGLDTVQLLNLDREVLATTNSYTPIVSNTEPFSGDLSISRGDFRFASEVGKSEYTPAVPIAMAATEEEITPPRVTSLQPNIVSESPISAPAKNNQLAYYGLALLLLFGISAILLKPKSETDEHV